MRLINPYVVFTLTSAALLQAEENKVRPLAKVVKLLNDMKTQLTAEQEDDTKVYEKLSCWCKKNDDEKDASITAAQRMIESLEASIKEYAASIAELEVKIEKVKDEYNKDWDALKTATELRMKEAAKFSQEEKEFLETIDACKQAIIVLSKHNAELAQVRNASKALTAVRGTMLHAESLTPEKKAKLLRFLNDAANPKNNISFLAIPGYKSYSSQSGEVFGILKQMQEDFQSNLSDELKREQTAREAFADLKAAKEEQMRAGRKQQSNYEEELADNMENKAQAEEDLHDTEENLSNDQKFLLNLRKRCSETDEEYHARQKSRNEEIAAVTETIKVLDNDDAFDVTGRSLGKTIVFTQVSSAIRETKISRAVQLLAKFSQRDPRMGMLAVSAKLDAFTKVKKAIDDMVANLQQEKKDEIKHRDFCINEFNQNERDQNAKADERDDLQTKKDTLEGEIKQLNTDITMLQDQIKETHTQLQRAAENREQENADFQSVINDQRVTQNILQKAKERMAQKYALLQAQQEAKAKAHDEPRVGAAHTVTSATKTDPGNGPARFNKYKHSQSGHIVIELLDKILADSEKMEKETIKDESDAQRAYEGFVWDSNKSIKEKNKAIVNKSETRAQANETLNITEGDLKQAFQSLELLNQHRGNLNKSCDFVLANFETRQSARDEEVQALREAKDILSGMK